jgi:hypothetical protein
MKQRVERSGNRVLVVEAMEAGSALADRFDHLHALENSQSRPNARRSQAGSSG